MKLLATDYDGTLCYAKNVQQEDLDAIRAWREEGNLFAIVTGRSKESIDKQIAEYNIPCDYIVTNNGGMVFDSEGRELGSNYLDFITSVDIFYAVKFYDNVISYVVNDGVHRHRFVIRDDIEDHRYPTMKSDPNEDEILSMTNYAQIVLSMTSREAAVEMAKIINDFFYETIVAYPNNYVVDIVPKGISKATGMEFLSEFVGVDEKDVYTIGDGHNDIPLMEYGVHGAVISSADPEIKMHAQNEYSTVSEYIRSIK